MKKIIEVLCDAIRAGIDHVAIDVDEPEKAGGEVFITLTRGAKLVVVQWSSDQRFGISDGLKSGFGVEAPDLVIEGIPEAVGEIARILDDE